MKKIILTLFVLTTVSAAFAQRNRSNRNTQNVTRDTTRPGTVVVTSAFKPSLKPAAKINFSAVPPIPDTTRPSLRYNVPAQNLFFSYNPIPLQPLALTIDTALNWQNHNFVKAGYGNYTSPYLQAGFSFGDGKNSIVNIHAKHISAKGQKTLQQFSYTNADAIGIFNDQKNNEWTAKVGFDNRTQYQYGFVPDTLKFGKDSLLRKYNNIGFQGGLRNRTVNAFGINYNPTIRMDIFNDNRNGRENNFVLDAPISKSVGRMFAFKVGLTADFTKYTTKAVTISNNLFYLTPALQFNTPNFKLNAGFTPSWDNSIFSLLPNFTADIKMKDEKFVVQAGWVGSYQKTTYQYLTTINPFIEQPTSLLNTRFREQYAGFKGSAGSHLNYNARVSFLKISNMPLFVNDTVTGRKFQVVNESDMKAVRVHGELGYTVAEKFSLTAGATFTQYSNLVDNKKAWGLIPLEVSGSLRWNVLKDLLIKSDVFFWDGPQYRNKQLNSQKQKAALDISAGAEFSILPKFNVWLQFNNILNNRYERWHQYEVLGTNVQAGIVYSFGK
jgi:hypothetical protein